jgi:hypothetical protein
MPELSLRSNGRPQPNHPVASEPRIGASDEYASLRAELATSRAYIFERPLAIAAIALAALAFDETHDQGAVATLVAILLASNLEFTVNRLENAARIVGYVRVVLEDRTAPWAG